MQRFLAGHTDEDAPHEALMLARSRASLSWGRLQGLLAHLAPDVARIFAYSLSRHALVEALVQSGFSDAKSRFSSWFCGLGSDPEATTHIFIPAWIIAEALLSELSRSRWAPLADAVDTLRRAAKFDRSGSGSHVGVPPDRAIEEALTLAARVPPRSVDDWPLAGLDAVHACAAQVTTFVTDEPSRETWAFAERAIVIDTRSSRAPLWALDLIAGSALAKDSPGTLPLPCPGAVRAEALAPGLWPRERAILVADALRQSSDRLILFVEAALASISQISHALANMRSTSRAPGLFQLLAGFGPLRPIQIESALGLSKNGVRDLLKRLMEAGLVEPVKVRGQLLIQPTKVAPSVLLASDRSDATVLDHEGRFAAFDAAMVEVDQLLERISGQSASAQTGMPIIGRS